MALHYNNCNCLKSECDPTSTSLKHRVTSSLSLHHLDNSLCDSTGLSREAAPFNGFLVSYPCISGCFVCVPTCFTSYHHPISLECRHKECTHALYLLVFTL